jgi:hypothetical protein
MIVIQKPSTPINGKCDEMGVQPIVDDLPV